MLTKPFAPGIFVLVVLGLAFLLGLTNPPVKAQGHWMADGQETHGFAPNGGMTPTLTSTPLVSVAYKLFLPVVLKPTTPAPLPTPTQSATHVPTLTPTATGLTPANLRIVVLSGTTTPEYVRIQNLGASAQDITGWSVVSVVGSQTFYFPTGFVLNPNATVELQSYDGAIHNPPSILLWTTIPIWNNNGDKAELHDDQGRLISDACYGEACP